MACHCIKTVEKRLDEQELLEQIATLASFIHAALIALKVLMFADQLYAVGPSQCMLVAAAIVSS